MDKRTWSIVAGTALVSFSAGVFGGFLYAKKTLVAGYNEMLEEETLNLKEYYSRLYKKGGFATPQDAADHLGVAPVQEVPEDTLQRLIEGLRYNAPPDAAEIIRDQLEENRNVFDHGEEEEDPETIAAEVDARTKDRPYIISQVEYLQNDPEYRQVSVTYYEGDQILADEKDEPIDFVDKYIGSENVTRFGYRSDDKNLVYVRNEKIEVDFEIKRSRGLYSEEVQGLHNRPTNPRRRIPSGQ